MYISTSHRLNDTVYLYRPDTDTVTRCKVVSMSHTMNAEGEFTSFVLRTSTGQVFTSDSDTVYSSPESAYYRNPLKADQEAFEALTAEVAA